MTKVPVLARRSTSASLSTGATRTVRLTGRAAPVREALRSPVSGVECVYWRLRIVEELEPTLRLVHEMASSEAFDVVDVDGARLDPHAAEPTSGGRVRIAPASSEIRPAVTVHRSGSPGAQAAARHFELAGALCIEEMLVRPGEALVAEGVLDGGDREAAPFRAANDGHELFGALVRPPGRVALGPVLLPWALGTAAALMAGIGGASYAAAHFDLVPGWRRPLAQPLRSSLQPVRFERRHFSRP